MAYGSLNRQQAERLGQSLLSFAEGGATKWRQTTPTANSLGGFTYQPSAAPSMLSCLQNPTTHYCANNVPSGDYGVISGNPNTWIDKGNIKSIYDPCPYGYRVPIDGSWNNWGSTHTQTWTNGDITSGAGIVMQSTWWPAAGSRYHNSAAMNNVANQANFWSSSPHYSGAYNSYDLDFRYTGNVYPRNSYGRSGGFSLRCVQE